MANTTTEPPSRKIWHKQRLEVMSAYRQQLYDYRRELAERRNELRGQPGSDLRAFSVQAAVLSRGLATLNRGIAKLGEDTSEEDWERILAAARTSVDFIRDRVHALIYPKTEKD